ncbi:MAG: 1-acyl-sn-glycerol-3-phosphate acyltransferase [Spirochaetes bacterium]|nr:1-acyl-sn-glycerol-3-phosphate acyltransferase [Spirochaetota bacterium]
MVENNNYKGGLVYSEKISKTKSPFLALWKTIFFDSKQRILLSRLFLRSFLAGKDIPKIFFYKNISKIKNLTYMVLKSWGEDIIKILKCQIYINGLDKIDKERNYLFISNHLSPVDIPLIYSTIPVLAGFVSNYELSYLPVFNFWMKKSNAVFIKFGDEKSLVDSLKKLIDNLKNGYNQILFPEGRMSPDGSVQNFNRGGIFSALITGIPIVPMFIKGTRECLKPGEFNFNLSVPLYIEYFDPIETNNISRNDKKNFVNYLYNLYKKFEEEFENRKDNLKLYNLE